MENFYTTVQTATGNVVNNATVTVYDNSTGLPATIYLPDGVTPLVNPFLSGYARSEGEIEFGAANGQYNIKIVNGLETDWIYRITLLDASGFAFGALAYENDASGVPIIDAGAHYASIDVEGALQESAVNLNNHLGDTTDAHDAAAISIVDAGGFYSELDVEGALQEVPFLPPAYAYFAENRNTTAPNTTVPVHQWVVDGAETDIDIALSPKGTGAIVAQVPDGTAAGGNKRGQYAVDLQTIRISALDVASGSNSVIAGGANNRASGNGAFVGGGTTNVASGSNAVISGGTNNTSSSTRSTISGGSSNTASGTNSTVSGGASNVASGIESTIPGGSYATTREMNGRYAYASGIFATTGDAQESKSILRLETTDATPSIATSNGSGTPSASGLATNVFALPDNHAYAITARIIGRDTTTGDVYHVVAEGTVKRATGVATTALDGTPAYTTISKSAGASTWAVALVANTTRGSAEIQVTGEAATTIHWVCKFDTVEVG